MQKQAPSFGRLAIMVGFVLSCFALGLFLWTSFGGQTPLAAQGYRVVTYYRDAPGLTAQADVRISGVNVGKVIGVTRQGDLTRADLELDPHYAPIPDNTRTIIRRATVLGEAYIELTPGTPPDRGGQWLPDGGALPLGHTKESVELDELLRAFNPKTRKATKVFMGAVGDALGKRGPDLNGALGYLRPLADDGAQTASVLRSQQSDVSHLIHDAGTGLEALAERRGALRGLIDNTSSVLSATASRNRQLTRSVQILPVFLDELRQTLTLASQVGSEAQPVLDAATPAVRRLPAILRNIHADAPQLRGLFASLGAAEHASRRGVPALTSILDTANPLIRALDPAVADLVPAVDYLTLYRRETAAWVAKSAAANNAEAGAGEHRRSMNRFVPILGTDSLGAQGQRLPSNRHNPYPRPGYLDQIGHGGLRAFDCENAAPSPNAPPCTVQPPITFRGFTGAYPHVRQLGK